MSYPTTFKGYLLYYSYCVSRNAVCLDFCRKCQCESSLYYSEDDDTCVKLPSSSTTPYETSTALMLTTAVSNGGTSSSVSFTTTEVSSKFSAGMLSSKWPLTISSSYTETDPLLATSTALASSSLVLSATKSLEYPKVPKPTSTILPERSRPTSTVLSQILHSTTPSLSGAKENTSNSTTSNTGLIVGLSLGVLVIIFCAFLLTCLRRKKKTPGNLMKFSHEDCQANIGGCNPNSFAENPVQSTSLRRHCNSPVAGWPANPRAHEMVINSPMYDAKLNLSQPAHFKLRADNDGSIQSDYQELIVGSVPQYSTQGETVAQDNDDEPVYGVIDEDPYYSEVPNSFIYSETGN